MAPGELQRGGLCKPTPRYHARSTRRGIFPSKSQSTARARSAERDATQCITTCDVLTLRKIMMGALCTCTHAADQLMARQVIQPKQQNSPWLDADAVPEPVRACPISRTSRVLRQSRKASPAPSTPPPRQDTFSRPRAPGASCAACSPPRASGAPPRHRNAPERAIASVPSDASNGSLQGHLAAPTRVSRLTTSAPKGEAANRGANRWRHRVFKRDSSREACVDACLPGRRLQPTAGKAAARPRRVCPPQY